MECTRLGISGGYVDHSSMAQLSPQKRKKRRVQLREAQRRRRARLKEESKSFLQIILGQEILLALRSYSDLVGKPLHTCATELIETGLELHQKVRKTGNRSRHNWPPSQRFWCQAIIILQKMPPGQRHWKAVRMPRQNLAAKRISSPGKSAL